MKHELKVQLALKRGIKIVKLPPSINWRDPVDRLYLMKDEIDALEQFDALGEELFHANPKCNHQIANAPGGGVKCKKCTGWFCY